MTSSSSPSYFWPRIRETLAARCLPSSRTGMTTETDGNVVADSRTRGAARGVGTVVRRGRRAASRGRGGACSSVIVPSHYVRLKSTESHAETESERKTLNGHSAPLKSHVAQPLRHDRHTRVRRTVSPLAKDADGWDPALSEGASSAAV